MRTKTGDYRIDFYDRYGKRLTGLSENGVCYSEALDRGKGVVTASEEVASFTVLRVLFNSLDSD